MSRVSLTDRTADHLRAGIRDRRWAERLPGIRPLASELGVSQHTLRAAILRLKADGILSGGKAGASYAIVPSPDRPAAGAGLSLNIAYMIRGNFEAFPAGWRAAMLRTADEAREAGHRCFFVTVPASRDLAKTGWLERIVAKSGADAWYIGNASREMLAWFAGSGLPALAIGGRHHGLDIACASFSMTEAVREATRRLIALGHRRIVTIIAETSRKPTPGPVATVFLEELSRAGIRAGTYNLPEWDETPEGLDALLDSLFKVTPPTALMCWPHKATMALLARLSARGVRVPSDISLFSMSDDPCFGWIYPGLRMAHLRHDDEGIRRRIREWTAAIAAGRKDRRQVERPSRFEEGNSFAAARE